MSHKSMSGSSISGQQRSSCKQVEGRGYDGAVRFEYDSRPPARQLCRYQRSRTPALSRQKLDKNSLILSRLQVRFSSPTLDVLLPASGGQPARALTMQRVRCCTGQRLGVCKLGGKCPKPHDPAAMANENEATKDLKCHAFAADGTCRFGKNCRFSHGAADFR